jgi:hypothetical protein
MQEVATRTFDWGLQYITAVQCRAEGSARSLQALTDYADGFRLSGVLG